MWWVLLLACSETAIESTAEPAFAAVRGDFDDPAPIFDRLLVDHVPFEGLIHRPVWDTGFDGEGALPVEALLSSEAEMSGFDLIVVGSGTRGLGALTYQSLEPDDGLLDAALADRVTQYVERRGQLWVTDWAYDLVELSYPSDVEWAGDDRHPDSAQLGAVGDVVAEVLDPQLQEVLGEQVVLHHPYTRWAVPLTVSPQVEVVLSGTATLEDGSTVEGVPMLFRIDGDRGALWYSTFDLSAQEPGVATTLLRQVPVLDEVAP